MAENEVSPNELRIRSITHIYYSKPEVQKALFEFANRRETVPRYFEGFGKRPDAITYPADIMALVQKGATSFHASEEIWRDPLQLNTDMQRPAFDDLREGWDLLLDIDSPYLDYSKLAGELLIELLERYGIKNYGIKYSGSKGLHIIVPWTAFPEVFEGTQTRTMFPEWPRAITEFLLQEIKPAYNRHLANLGIDFKAIERRTKVTKDELVQATCDICNSVMEKHVMMTFECDRCRTRYERPDVKITKRKLRCIDPVCSGFFNLVNEREFVKCPKCNTSSLNKQADSSNKVVYSQKQATASVTEQMFLENLGSLDFVLVSPRHLFRMPYSLHEKTSLASVVIKKEDIASFTPKKADPLTAQILPYYPNAVRGEATLLLQTALAWRRKQDADKPQRESVATQGTQSVQMNERDIELLKTVTEDHFPAAIKKLLRGLSEGRKRGLFILITFLRALNIPDVDIEKRVYEWNERNAPPLKEGYVKSQLQWHFRQTRKILPPNYDNPSFYKDLGLLEKPAQTKNPLVDVMRLLRRSPEHD